MNVSSSEDCLLSCGLADNNEGYVHVLIMKSLCYVQDLRLVPISQLRLLVAKDEVWRHWLPTYDKIFQSGVKRRKCKQEYL